MRWQPMLIALMPRNQLVTLFLKMPQKMPLALRSVSFVMMLLMHSKICANKIKKYAVIILDPPAFVKK
jgi:hypothetical protein